MHEPAERDRACALRRRPRACGFAATGASSSASTPLGPVIAGSRWRKPSTAPTPLTSPITTRVAASTAGRRRAAAGRRSMASPMTPPRPVGSGQCGAARQAGREARGEQTRRRARTHSRIHSRSSGRWVASASPRPRPAAPARSAARPNSCISRSARDRAGDAEQIAHRRVGGVAEGRVLHRPGRERDREQRRRARSARRRRFAQRAAASASRRSSDRKLRLSRAACRSPTWSMLRSAEHRDEAMQRLGGGLLVLHQRDADDSPRRDCCRRRCRARDSGRARRAGRPRATASASTASSPPCAETSSQRKKPPAGRW